MELFSAVIKGDRSQAQEACKAKGIKYVFRTEVDSGRESVLTVESTWEEMARWMVDPRSPFQENFGYPVGSLLWYAEHKENN